MRLISRTKTSYPQTGGAAAGWVRATAAFVGLGFAIAFPSPGTGCPVFEPTDQIAIDLGGGQTSMLLIYVDELSEAGSDAMSLAGSGPASEGSASRCSAAITLPLSAFPTSRLAHRPAEIARSMKDVMKKLDVGACDVSVLYDNDTNEDIAEHELCLRETFAFGERKHWSISSESFCWAPEDFAVVSSEESIEEDLGE